MTCPVLVPFLPPLNYLPGKNHIANKTPFTTTKARQGRTGASARFPGGSRAAQVPAERSGAACPGGAVTER